MTTTIYELLATGYPDKKMPCCIIKNCYTDNPAQYYAGYIANDECIGVFKTGFNMSRTYPCMKT